MNDTNLEPIGPCRTCNRDAYAKIDDQCLSCWLDKTGLAPLPDTDD